MLILLFFTYIVIKSYTDNLNFNVDNLDYLCLCIYLLEILSINISKKENIYKSYFPITIDEIVNIVRDSDKSAYLFNIHR